MSGVVERQMVRRMAYKGLLLAPVLIGALWAFGGSRYAVSGAVGLAMTLGNLWFSAVVIGKVAEANPTMLMPAGLATFILTLLLLTGAAVLLQTTGLIVFPVTGFTLIGTHLGLVLWEATGAYKTPIRSGG